MLQWSQINVYNTVINHQTTSLSFILYHIFMFRAKRASHHFPNPIKFCPQFFFIQTLCKISSCLKRVVARTSWAPGLIAVRSLSASTEFFMPLHSSDLAKLTNRNNHAKETRPDVLIRTSTRPTSTSLEAPSPFSFPPCFSFANGDYFTIIGPFPRYIISPPPTTKLPAHHAQPLKLDKYV